MSLDSFPQRGKFPEKEYPLGTPTFVQHPHSRANSYIVVLLGKEKNA
jgi:hypothetical protein